MISKRKPKPRSKRNTPSVFCTSMSLTRSQPWRTTTPKFAEMSNRSRTRMFSKPRFHGGTNSDSSWRETSWTLPVFLRPPTSSWSWQSSQPYSRSSFSRIVTAQFKVCRIETAPSFLWLWQSLSTQSRTSSWSSLTSVQSSLEKSTTICTQSLPTSLVK
jgi:hypothetical protein